MRKALFLDRDGVINVEKNYVYRSEDFEFLPGIFDLCVTAKRLGFMLVVVTNQAGIGRGYYTENDFRKLTQWMLLEFRAKGIEIDRVYHCPYHPTAGVGDYRRESFDRKPNPGMILKARQDLNLDLSRCVLLGDKDSDIEAGRSGGVGHLLKLVHFPPSSDSERDRGTLQVNSLSAAADWLQTAFRPEQSLTTGQISP
jgi:D-glycero-D-manno-heptose 1,7-bisphosphate phosphatase